MPPPRAGTSDCTPIRSSLSSSAHAGGTPRSSCPTICQSHPFRRARPLGAPVQEPPTLYKFVRFLRLPLRGTYGACPRRVQELPTAHQFVRLYRPPLTRAARRGRRALRSVNRTRSVGRDHWARRCRNRRLCTNSFVFSACRFAERMGHAPSLQPSIESALQDVNSPKQQNLCAAFSLLYRLTVYFDCYDYTIFSRAAQ